MAQSSERTVSVDDLRPNVLNVGYTPGIQRRTGHSGVRTPERYAYDYEIEFFLADGGTTWVDGTAYEIKKGHLIFRRPGQTCNSIPPYSCWYLNLDLLGDSGKTIDDYRETRYLRFQDRIDNPCLNPIPACMKVQNESRYIDCFSAINLLARSKSETDRLALRIRLLELIHLISQDACNTPANRAQRESVQAVMETLGYIHAHYSEKITLEKLGEKANLSPIYFHRLFVRTTRKTPGNYLQQVRLDRARYQLLHTTLTCSEIASVCGFSTPSYFSQVFRSQFALTPQAFRLRYLGIDQQIVNAATETSAPESSQTKESQKDISQTEVS
jgi:AraC-like DNA-binding protein